MTMNLLQSARRRVVLSKGRKGMVKQWQLLMSIQWLIAKGRLSRTVRRVDCDILSEPSGQYAL